MSFEGNYSTLDRVIHRVAFASRMVQLTAADVEAALYGRRFRRIAVEKPVFITSLPRAGTTLLLEVFDRLPGFATHRYRDMPFILAPLLWDALSRNFRKDAVLRERAHGDGVAVGYDSPEAFEEVLWRALWPEKYHSDRIALWADDETTDEFRDFFVAHIQKIVALRSGGAAAPGRYVSKNNANIARIGLLRRLFPDCTILVPFRHPMDHAASLWRQHGNFLALHGREGFTRRYMEDIGHLEFGELHRPICFDGVDGIMGRYRPDGLDYWLAYWVAAFGHIVRRRQDIELVSYERACADGSTAMEAIGDRLGLADDGALATAAALFRAPARHDADSGPEDSDLVDRARSLHRDLLALSIV